MINRDMISTSPTFIDVLSDNAKDYSEKTALVDDSGSYTYSELDKLSNGVAVKLIGQGIGPGDIVPILMTRSKAFVAAFIGVMKSGAAFVPLDINYPEERIKSIEDSVEAKIVIDEEWMKDVTLSDEFINNSKPDDMAFIIFTSGSTGKPKGVIRNHRSVFAMAKATKESCDLNDIYKCSTFLGFQFIGGMDDVISYLFSGCENFIVPETMRKDPSSLSKWLNDNKIDAMNINPSIGQLLFDGLHTSLKRVSFVGEKIVNVPESTVVVSQKYGCTEFVPASYNPQVDSNDYSNIGHAVVDVNTFIVTDNNLLAIKGEVGELCLVGPQMASGYWKMPELTAEKFVHCPFLPGDVKMYKTGDLARYREDGNIELVGRKDFQIKIRGFRIEPGEIENVAVKFDGIDTVVVVSKEMGNEKQLVLYYTSNTQVDETRLKEYLSKYLADYMVPNFYVRLDEMPRNANGKIDRGELPDSKIIDHETADKPKTTIENAVFQIIAEQIDTECFGVNDKLVDLGISSLGLLNIVATISELGYNINTSEISLYDSVLSISSRISEKRRDSNCVNR